MAIIGSASIQIRADDKFFEPDVRRSLKKLKNLEIVLRVDADISKASKKIRDLRYRITSKDAVLKVDADTSKAEEKMRQFLERFVDREMEFTATANTQGANTAFTELRDRFAASNVPFTAAANTAAAQAQLAYAARNRLTLITAIFDEDSRRALKGMFATLTGTIPVAKIKAALVGLAAGFEGLATKAGIVTAALGALSAAALAGGANLFSIVADVGQLVGLVALLPAGLFGLITVLKANKMAWEGFGTAAKDNSEAANKALAKLPPEAQKAAVALRGVREQIQRPVQKAFWVAAGTSLQDMVKTQLPSVIRGMSMIAASMGGFSKEVFNTIENLGDFNDVFLNVSDSIDNMVGGIKPAIVALDIFTGIGSRFLPGFGTWLAELGIKFGDFAKQAEASGAIVSWINTGVQRLKELGSVASSTVGIFNGLANAARMSGAAGLTDLANGMKNVRDIVNGEPFQSRLVAILEGARTGVDRMGEGFSTLTDLVGRSAAGIGIFLDKAGEVAGLTFENITKMFDGTGLGSGLMEALDGLGRALEILQPGFGDLGSTIGDLGEIAGELFVNTASGLNMLFSTLEGVVAGLKDGIVAAMPVFNSFIQGLLSVVAGPLVTFAEGIGNILEGFAQLPGIVQNALTVLVLFLAIGPKIAAMWANVRTGAANTFSNLANDVDAAGTRSQNSFGRSADAIRDSWRNVGTTLSQGSAMSGFLTNTERMTSAVGSVSSAIGTTASQGLRMAGGGLMSALGGPWGVAIAGAAALVGTYAAAQADARAKVDELKASLDQQTGAFTNASRKVIASDIIDFDSGKDGWSQFWRFGRETAVENMGKIGLSVDEVTKKLTDGESGQRYADSWKQIGIAAANSIGGTLEISDELAASVGMTAEELEGLGGIELNSMAASIRIAGERAETARREIQELAEHTKTNTIAAAQLAKNYDILSSSTSSASDKFSAMKHNIDLLSGGQRTAHGAAREYAQSLDDQHKSMTSLITTHGGIIDSAGRVNDAFRATLLNTDNTFSTATQGARDFSTQMDVAADNILKSGTAALDGALKAGKSMPEAMAAAMHQMEPAVATLRSSLGTLGFDAGQVDAIIKQLGLDPEKLTAAMSVDTDKAMLDVARLKLSMSSYADGNYTAVLAALPQQAKDALTSTMGLGDLFAQGKYEAILAALDDTAGGREAALASLLSYDGTDWLSHLKANNLVGPEVAKANADAAKLLAEKNMVLRAEDLVTDVLESVNYVKFDEKQVDFTANDKVSDIIARVNASPLSDKTTTLGTEDLVSQMVNEINEKQLNNKLTKLESQDLVTAVLGEVNSKTLDGKHATLTAEDLATMVVNHANIVALNDKANTLSSTDNASPAADGANAVILANKANFLNTTDAATPVVAGANSILLGNKANFLNTTDGATPVVAGANSVLLGNKANILSTADNASPKVTAANGLSLFDKSATLSVKDNATDTVRAVDNKKIADKSFNIFGNFAENIKGMFGLANGGIISGSGVQTFANGGILKGQRKPEIKAYAGGGVENHVAQIARGAWPVRVWAEPETGGEAYIPLSKSKRKRSLEVLRKVMDEFGLSEFAQFAEGGVVKQSYTTPSVVSSRYSAEAPVSTTTAAAYGTAPGAVVNFTVNPSQGLSEQQIGEAAMKELYWQLSSR